MAKATPRPPAPPPAPTPPDAAILGQPAPAPPAVVHRICAACLFWARIPNGPDAYLARDVEGEFGLCRRKSPIPLMTFNAVVTAGPFTFAPAIWPRTYAGENCGEGEFVTGVNPS
jgi:hypothetical protein